MIGFILIFTKYHCIWYIHSSFVATLNIEECEDYFYKDIEFAKYSQIITNIIRPCELMIFIHLTYLLFKKKAAKDIYFNRNELLSHSVNWVITHILFEVYHCFSDLWKPYPKNFMDTQTYMEIAQIFLFIIFCYISYYYKSGFIQDGTNTKTIDLYLQCPILFKFFYVYSIDKSRDNFKIFKYYLELKNLEKNIDNHKSSYRFDSIVMSYESNDTSKIEIGDNNYEELKLFSNQYNSILQEILNSLSTEINKEKINNLVIINYSFNTENQNIEHKNDLKSLEKTLPTILESNSQLEYSQSHKKSLFNKSNDRLSVNSENSLSEADEPQTYISKMIKSIKVDYLNERPKEVIRKNRKDDIIKKENELLDTNTYKLIDAIKKLENLLLFDLNEKSLNTLFTLQEG